MPDLTARQQQVYDYIRHHQQRLGYAPTLQEIAGHLGIRGNLGVLRHLEALEKKGFIRRTPGSSRGIALAERDRLTAVELPVLGTVPAGPLAEALADADGSLALDPSLARGVGCFALRVRGDSMIEAQIAPGDLAVVRPQAMAENGEIVVAMVDGEATLKRFFREAGLIRLQPENSSLQPILLRPEDGEVRILGKVTAIIRTLED